MIWYGLKAWFIGLLFAAFIVIPLIRAMQGLEFEAIWQELEERSLGYIVMLPSSFLMAFTFGLVLSLPLFLIAIVSSFFLEKQIASHPNFFVVLASIITATIVALLYATEMRNQWDLTHDFWGRFRARFLSWDTWIFALPILPAAFYFCNRLKDKNGTDR
ncbi:MAG: hypothetical protein ABJP66_18435 [Hyphomicrobiales bacterium]